MKITATEESGLRCMLHLALRPGETVSLADMAESEGMAAPFTAKVLLRLRRAGLVEATRGRNGGYRLAEPADSITVARILGSLGTPLFDAEFCRKRPQPDSSDCSRMADCSLRPVWAHLDALLREFFDRTTLADLAAGERQTDRHLKERWPLVVATMDRAGACSPKRG